MNVLIIGSGGREHALAWKLARSPLRPALFFAPGNPGMASLGECVAVPLTEIRALVDFARERNIDLTVVGPEQPLVDGIVNEFRAHGLTIFGPTKEAAEIEGSKAFAKEFMRRHRIPTAGFAVFSRSQFDEAVGYLSSGNFPVVIKASGLAAGKGVIICNDEELALATLRNVMNDRIFGDAGSEIVIEDFLQGEEVSVLALTDGKHILPLTPAQDHKRILDDDQGNNTGGMGAYAPAPFVTDDVMDEIVTRILRPTVLGMAVEGRPYSGCLYAGLMLTKSGPKVIEFNCRFGDPETQAVLPVLSEDLLPLLNDAARGELKVSHVSRPTVAATAVVMASGGYPGQYRTGMEILGIDAVDDSRVVVFHAGTRTEKGKLVTSGGRVLSVTAVSEQGDLEESVDAAYDAVHRITFDGAYYRSDIGRRGLRFHHIGKGE